MKIPADGAVDGPRQVSTKIAMHADQPSTDGLARSADKAEGHLDLGEETFRLIVDTIKDGILLVNRDGQVLYANAAAAKIFGRSCEELVDRPAGIFIPTEQELRSTIIRPDRTMEEVELKAVEIAWNGRPACLVTLQDVSARRARQEQLRQLQKLEMLGSLSAGITHDFRNLIAVVQSGLRLIGNKVSQGASQANIATLVEEVMRRTQKAEELTSQLLAFSRKRERALQPVNVNRRIDSVISMIAQAAGEGVVIQTNLAADVGAAMIDAYELDVALLNLVINGRDAMNRRGVLTIETGIDRQGVSPETPAGSIRVTVRDTGDGMPAEVKERVLEPFFTTKGEGYGTGLGLNQVYGFVERSGGHIRIDSEEGAGTAVHLFLPRRADNDDRST